MNIKHLINTIVILLAFALVFGAAMFGLNFITGPIIERHNEGAANDRLNAVMPGGSSYEDITANLSNLPASVIKVNREKNGLGYVLECTASSQYTGSTPMDIVIGVDTTGKICGIQLVSHSESLIFGADYPSTYIGKDSALADVGLYAGSTFSSTAFKTAVEEAMNTLIVNNMIAAGVKSDAQILTEMIPTLAPGMLKTEDVAVSGNIEKALKAGNDAGFAYVIKSGDASYLALVNAFGACRVYDVAGTDVTGAQTAVADEAKACAAANQKSYVEALNTKISRLFEDASELTVLETDIFNTVVAAVSFKSGGTDYYGFYSRSYGFDQMDVYVIIDANGAIAKVDAKAFFFKEEYFDADDSVDISAYKNSFSGLTESTFTGDNTVITGATMTSNAMKQSTDDAFATFNAIKGGAQ